jgi:hypothetical protein
MTLCILNFLRIVVAEGRLPEGQAQQVHEVKQTSVIQQTQGTKLCSYCKL